VPVSLNSVPNGAIVKIVKIPDDRLRELGVVENAVVKVIVSIRGGPALVGVDGRVVVVDSSTASRLLVEYNP